MRIDYSPKSFRDMQESRSTDAKCAETARKGKVERGVGYVKNSDIQGREFDSVAARNEFQKNWEATVADTRIHGKTKRHVGQHIEKEEKRALVPLPKEHFPYYEEANESDL